jgi:hypothetical protein
MPKARILATEALSELTSTETPGRLRVRLIDAGEGSSAIYPPEVLQQAVADRIFAKGMHMHLDHPTDQEAAERPIRSTKDWVSVLGEDAVFNPDTQALEANVQVFAPYQPLLTDKAFAENVGLSIRTMIEAKKGTGPGGKPIAERFLNHPVNTVDWVTKPGRGGMVLEVLEGAQPALEATTRERREQLQIALKAAYAPGDDQYIWVRDFDEDEHLVWFEDQSDRCWQQAFTPADDDLSVALTGDPVEVRPTTTYVPVTAPQESLSAAPPEAAGQSESTQPKESLMDIDEAELAKLRAEAARAAQLQTERDEATARAEAAEAALARGKEIDTALESVTVADPIKDRVRTVLEAHVGEITEQVVSEAVKAETEYLTKATEALGVGGIKGFGASQPATEATKPKRTRDAWGDPISKEK